MTEGLSAILGFHPIRSLGKGSENFMMDSLSDMIGRRGYTDIQRASTPEEMLALCKERQFDLYLMDVNLGYPNQRVFDTAKAIYEQEKERILAGKAKFFAMAGMMNVVESAQQEGIPTMTKYDFDNALFAGLLGSPQPNA